VRHTRVDVCVHGSRLIWPVRGDSCGNACTLCRQTRIDRLINTHAHGRMLLLLQAMSGNVERERECGRELDTLSGLRVCGFCALRACVFKHQTKRTQHEHTHPGACARPFAYVFNVKSKSKLWISVHHICACVCVCVRAWIHPPLFFVIVWFSLSAKVVVVVVVVEVAMLSGSTK